MKASANTALGIDVSQTHISLALLKKDSKGIRLVKAARCPVPDGAMKDGGVQDPAALCRAIRALAFRNRIRAHAAAMSIPSGSLLMQIIDMPKQMPANINQFVQDEVKQYVALSGERIVSDFCGITSAVEGSNRILVTAADGQKVASLIRVCGRAGVNVETVEPPVLAYVRACYAKKIAPKFNRNVLLALLHDQTLTICVFRKRALDLVRTKDLGAEPAQPQALINRLAGEIEAVIQFYDIEVPGDSRNWEVTLVTNDAAQVYEKAEELLKGRLPDAQVQVRTLQDAYRDTPIGSGLAGSVEAIGLAMRRLQAEDNLFKVNLLPKEIIQVRSLRRQILVTANIVAAVLLITMLIVHGLGVSIEKVNKSIERRIQVQPPQGTSTLVAQKRLLDQQIKQLSEGPGQLAQIITRRRDVGWAGLLHDIKNGAPDAVCITRLLSKDNLSMSLEGLALSYDAIHLFVSMLDKSEHILSASLVKAQKDEGQGGLIKYEISCSLMSDRRKANSVN